MASESLIIRIGADSKKFQAEIDKIKGRTKELESGLKEVAKISAAAFAALTASVGLAVREFAKFESSFTNVQTLLDQSSFKTKSFTKGIEDLKNGVLEVGAKSGQSFDILNKGLFDIVSAGIDAEQSISVLNTATELAIAGATDTSVAVDGLTSAINAFSLKGEDAASVAQKFFLAQKAGKTTVEELASGFGLAASTASSFGVSLDELLGSVSAVTLGGVKTNAAYTGLAAVLANISQPTALATEEARRLGVEFDSQSLRTKGLAGFFDDLTSSQNFNQQSLEKLFGSIEAKKFVFALLRDGASDFKDQLAALSDESKLAATFQDALEVKQKTLNQALNRGRQALDAAAIVIGEQFAPVIIRAADAITAFAQEITQLTSEQKESIANFIKAGLAITAFGTGISGLILGVIKATQVIAALRVGFTILRASINASRFAAVAFAATVSGGLSLIVSFLPEIIDGFKTLYGLFSKSEEPKTLSQIESKLISLKEKQREINNIPYPGREDQLKDLDAEIQKYEELKQKKMEAENVQPAPPLGPSNFVVQSSVAGNPLDEIDKIRAGAQGPVDVPIRPAGQAAPTDEVPAASADKTKKAEQEKTKAVSEETQKRLDALRNEQEVLKAQRDAEDDKEVEFLQRRQKINQEFRDAEAIGDQEERDLALENVRLKNEALLQEEANFKIAKDEQAAEDREKDEALQEELDALDQERRDELDQKELDDLHSQILTKKQAQREADKEDLAANIQRRNQYLKDEARYGAAVARVNQVLNSQQLQQAETAANQLVQLNNSKNDKLKAIGKASSRVLAAIDTARGAIAAYQALAGVPLIGPGLGIAAAAALTAYGIERQREISAAAQGGIIGNTNTNVSRGGLRDRVPAFLEPGEIVVPKALTPNFVQQFGRGAPPASTTNNVNQEVRITIEDEATDFISARQVQNSNLYTGIVA